MWNATKLLAVSCAAIALSSCGAEPASPDAHQVYRLEVVAGDRQEGLVGRALAETLTVRAVASDGRALAGVPIQWTPGGGGTAQPVDSATNASGEASAVWTLGSAFRQVVVASAGQRRSEFAASIPVHAVFFEAAADVWAGDLVLPRYRALDANGSEIEGAQVDLNSLRPLLMQKTSGGLHALRWGTALVAAAGVPVTDTLEIRVLPVFRAKVQSIGNRDLTLGSRVHVVSGEERHEVPAGASGADVRCGSKSSLRAASSRS